MSFLETAKRNEQRKRLFALHTKSQEKILAWQSKHLRGLLVVAWNNVPLFKEQLQQHNVYLSSIDSVSDIHNLPTVSKELLLSRSAEEYMNYLADPVWRKTPGHSGKQLTILVSEMHKRPWYFPFSHFRHVVSPPITPEKLQALKIARVDSDRRSLQNIDILLGKPGNLLHDMPSGVSARFIFTTKEHLDNEMWQALAKKYSAEVFDCYSMEEFGAIASECKEHSGMHINSEHIILEVVDSSNQPVEIGTPGNILITDLFNFNMPLIRYETGDTGKILKDPCPCGLQTPRVELLAA